MRLSTVGRGINVGVSVGGGVSVGRGVCVAVSDGTAVSVGSGVDVSVRGTLVGALTVVGVGDAGALPMSLKLQASVVRIKTMGREYFALFMLRLYSSPPGSEVPFK